MDAGTVSLVLSGLAIVVSGGAVYFTWRQAKASESQVTEARRAADIAEADSRASRSADLESRLRAALSLTLAGDDPINLTATIKSAFPERLTAVSVALLPTTAEPIIGFRADDDKALVSLWTMTGLGPGEETSRVVTDLRPEAPGEAQAKFMVTEGDLSCSWTVTLQINYPPRVYVF